VPNHSKPKFKVAHKVTSVFYGEIKTTLQAVGRENGHR
jgi:hypothetical protein